MTDRYDEKIDEALGGWPDVEAYPEEAVAAKTMSRIRANFPPKSKLTMPDDALLAAPLPAEPGEGIDPDATERTSAAEIRPFRAAQESEKKFEEKSDAARKSSENDVPIGRASSIPPPSSGVSRSEKTAAPASNRPSVADAPKREDRMGQVERQRDRTSFKDLAKLAATPPPPSAKPSSAKVPISASSASPVKEGDSGVVDLQAAALSDPHGAERAKSTPLASGSLFEDDAAPHSVPPPSLSGEHRASGPLSAVQSVDPYSPASVRPSAPPSSAPLSQTLASAGPHSAVAALAAAAPQQKEEKKGSPIVAILGGLVAVGGIAAGAFFYVHSHRAPVASAAVDTKPEVAVAATQAPAAPQTNADSTHAQPATNDAPQIVAQNDVTPAAVAKTTKSAPAGHAASKQPSKPSAGGSSGGGGALADAMEKDTSSTPPPAPPAADTTPAPATGASGSLKDAMQTAAGPSDSNAGQKDAPSGPKFAPGSVPQRPSQGALASAIGRVLPDARACLGPDDGVSYATIVFESAGGVQNVTLSGFAANKPAGSCITTALKKASVGPFAETTYSAKVTVRP